MLKNATISIAIIASLSACTQLKTVTAKNQPKNLLFINNELNTKPVNVQRDDKLCDEEKDSNKDCPIKFYIDDFKAGDFYINNATTYYLKPNEYVLSVKNCKEECKTYHTKLIINEQFQGVNIVLSLDNENRPFIINKKS
ncbi:hypothetical protein A7P53_12570 [Acinetobacter defluvii]|uniref:Lipoprotein n=1 Tax=Acinetobacter defluvii TaxID=1871111 RepID=A0A2S2FFH6_9GAMM|nr:hypothetical protein [Acinetobacter defluvii]AWL29689.1 hypothetical protein DJ533_14480 [Acinetobacter defluvii]NNP73392.1 hypothetical protein [Acinetobacter defluvii]